MVKIRLWASCIFLIFSVSCSSVKSWTRADGTKIKAESASNIIFMIVDGMGLEYIRAARIYNGQRPFDYENFSCSTLVSTCPREGVDNNGKCDNFEGEVTDSAAAATAMATGFKVNNGVISKEPSKREGGDLETILEFSKAFGKSTGIVATKLFSDATPAAFVSHADHRDHVEEILRDTFLESQPNVIFGADNALHRQFARKSAIPYSMVHTAADLKNISAVIANNDSCKNPNCPYVYGGFGQHDLIPGIFLKKTGLPLEIADSSYFLKNDIPHLSQMTEAALNILSKNRLGFFLMVESSMPDIIGHHHFNIDELENAPKAVEVLIREMLEVNNTIKVIDAFVAQHPDTLVVLTADHETGGLEVLEHETACIGEYGCVPKVRWKAERDQGSKDSLARHTGIDVALYAKGPGAERFCRERIDNTDIPKLALGK